MIDNNQNTLFNFSQLIGGLHCNSLIDTLGAVQADDEEPTVIVNSEYLDNQALIDVLKQKQTVFKVLSLNCQSLFAKFDQLTVYLSMLQEEDCSFDAICLQETWVSRETDLSMFNLNGYKLISKHRTCSAHGGLGIFLKDNFSHKILLSDENNNDSWEHQFIEVTVNEKTQTKLIMGNIYRLPRETNCDYDTFIEQLSMLLDRFEMNPQSFALFGDFNIDLLKIREKPKVNEFFEFMMARGFIPKITMPTRFSRNNATLIDNVFCKISHNLSQTLSGISLSNISDHQPYFVSFDYLNICNKMSRRIKVQTCSESNIINFKTDLESQNLVGILSHDPNADPNENYDKLDKVLQELKEKHFPVKHVNFNKYRHKKNKWITRGIMNSIRFRDRMYKRLKLTPQNTVLHETLRINLSTYNKILKSNIRLAKSQYYHTVFDKYKKDIKHTWITIKELLNNTTNDKQLPSQIRLEGNNISDPQTIANNFNKYFNDIGPSLAEKINSPNIDFSSYLTENASQNFKFNQVTEEIVNKIIDNFPAKTSCGIDNISMKLVKKIKDVLLTPLCIVINQSLTTGIFPDKLKIAKIVPVHKKDDVTIIDNYRPISVLPAISKIFEKIILNQLTEHFNSLNLLFPSQYGFRESHNTEYAVMENIDKIVENIEARNLPLNIFLDLSKAFDTLDHSILLYKLSHYGITGMSYKLCESYLSNRQQYVMYNGYKSDLLPIRTGVPQGSILGPLFFLIYMNDFDRSTNVFKFIMYADDTTLLATLSAVTDAEMCTIENNINYALACVNNWLKTNKLSLNSTKTKFMIFHPRNKHIPNLKLSIEDTDIENVDKFDFLGITVDKNLTWDSHIFKIQMKIAKVCGIMNRLKHFIPIDTLLTLYSSLIQPHLLYGILLWGQKSNKLFKLQKKILRIITNSRYNSHTDPLFKKCEVLKVKDILHQQEWKFYHKLQNGKLPHYFLQYTFVRHLDQHSHATRHSHLLVIPQLRYELSKCSIKYRLPHLINQAPQNIIRKINTHSLNGFSLYLKKEFICDYTTACTLPQCYVCQR